MSNESKGGAIRPAEVTARFKIGIAGGLISDSDGEFISYRAYVESRDALVAVLDAQITEIEQLRNSHAALVEQNAALRRQLDVAEAVRSEEAFGGALSDELAKSREAELVAALEDVMPAIGTAIDQLRATVQHESSRAFYLRGTAEKERAYENIAETKAKVEALLRFVESSRATCAEKALTKRTASNAGDKS